MDFSDPAPLHEACKLGKMRSGSLLCSGENDAVISSGGLYDGSTLRNMVANRLFNVSVFSSLASHHCDRRMPVIRGRDLHRVNILQLQELTKVGKLACIRARPCFPFSSRLFIDI